uniref:Uncharacterized protein n=1 Tax=Plectus sambesii TaxID=2011161 RepID=A0A914VSC8_9BILA
MRRPASEAAGRCRRSSFATCRLFRASPPTMCRVARSRPMSAIEDTTPLAPDAAHCATPDVLGRTIESLSWPGRGRARQPVPPIAGPLPKTNTCCTGVKGSPPSALATGVCVGSSVGRRVPRMDIARRQREPRRPPCARAPSARTQAPLTPSIWGYLDDRIEHKRHRPEGAGGITVEHTTRVVLPSTMNDHLGLSPLLYHPAVSIAPFGREHRSTAKTEVDNGAISTQTRKLSTVRLFEHDVRFTDNNPK